MSSPYCNTPAVSLPPTDRSPGLSIKDSNIALIKKMLGTIIVSVTLLIAFVFSATQEILFMMNGNILQGREVPNTVPLYGPIQPVSVQDTPHSLSPTLTPDPSHSSTVPDELPSYPIQKIYADG